MKTQKQRTWLLPLILGIVVPLTAWAVYRYIYPPLPSDVIATARRLHCDPYELNEVSQLHAKIGKQGDCNAKEWQRLLTLLKSSNRNIYDEALACLKHLQRSAYREPAIQIATEYLHKNDPHIRVTALITLWRLNAPGWQAEVSQRMQDADEGMCQTAQNIDRKSRRGK